MLAGILSSLVNHLRGFALIFAIGRIGWGEWFVRFRPLKVETGENREVIGAMWSEAGQAMDPGGGGYKDLIDGKTQPPVPRVIRVVQASTNPRVTQSTDSLKHPRGVAPGNIIEVSRDQPHGVGLLGDAFCHLHQFRIADAAIVTTTCLVIG